MKTLNKQLKAFTLTELMVVLVIIGILMLVALPIVMPLISKTHSLEAQKQLQYLVNLEKSHYQMHFKYTDDFNAVGFQAPKTVLEGGSAKYAYEIVNSGQNQFRAKATAVVDFDQDGVFNVWEIDQEGVLKQVVPD